MDRGKIRKSIKSGILNLRMKLILSLSTIAAMLLITSIISTTQFNRMNHYVSTLFAEDVSDLNLARSLSDAASKYNLDILTVIGEDALTSLPDFDRKSFVKYCDSLRRSSNLEDSAHLADSVMYAYASYMLTSLELPDVLCSDFIDTRNWYFEILQPQYSRLNDCIDRMTTEIYNELKMDSNTFNKGYNRSITPGIVSVGVGVLLVLMLLFFILSYYVNPIVRMRNGLANFRSYGKKYTCEFDGDDELREINDGIAEITADNLLLRRRIKNLKESVSQKESDRI